MATALYIDGKGPPPTELLYGWQAYDFHALPCPGGLRDQPYNLMRRMRVCYNAWTAYKDYIDNQLNVKWVEKNPEKWKIVVVIMELMAEHDQGKLRVPADMFSIFEAWLAYERGSRE